jgi:hypothetical protein
VPAAAAASAVSARAKKQCRSTECTVTRRRGDGCSSAPITSTAAALNRVPGSGAHGANACPAGPAGDGGGACSAE